MQASEYRRALVTGASRGIGAAVAASLVARGLDVTALALDDDELRATAATTGSRPVGVDLRDTTAVERVLTGTEFDVVVNNAGVLPGLAPFTTATASAIDVQIDINLRAALQVTRLVLPGMVARNRGHLFFLGSIAGKHPTPNSAVYCATKAALHAFAEALRCDLLGTQVRVTVLMPGRVETQLYDAHFGGSDAAAEALYRDIDAVQPADIATVIGAALDMPPSVDLTTVEVLPTAQIFGGSTIARRTPAE